MKNKEIQRIEDYLHSFLDDEQFEFIKEDPLGHLIKSHSRQRCLILDLDYRAKYYEQETKSWFDKIK